ncbi:hypothetical protein D3C72_245270 [compost metagenome]
MRETVWEKCRIVRVEDVYIYRDPAGRVIGVLENMEEDNRHGRDQGRVGEKAAGSQ